MSTAPSSHPQPAPERRWSRFFLIAFLVMLTPFVVVATTIAATGTVTVRVQDHTPGGWNVFVPVPALLVDVAAMIVPRFIPDEELADVRREMAPYREGLAELVRSLEDCPSGTLVRVESGRDRVVVEKQRNRLRVRVTGPEVNVDVSVPARLARRALEMVDLI